MKKYKHLLFDLDGTLSDPKEGIVNSVQYALSKFGMKEENDRILTAFIGPPLIDSFKEFYGFSQNKANLAIHYFREYFKDQGIFQNKLFPGVPEILSLLHDNDLFLYIATSKLEIFAIQIMEHFELKHLFKDVTGCFPDGTRVEKAEIIAHILQKHKLNLKECLMIGDRKHDIIGAKKNGMDCAGVLFGYGSLEEIQSYAPDYIFESVSDFKKILDWEL